MAEQQEQEQEHANVVALERHERQQLAQPEVLSRSDIEILKDTIAKDATDEELSFFLRFCRSARLDPFKKQVYLVKRYDPQTRREVMSIQTGIDGYRAIAGRTGRYRGQVGPWWCGQDGVWVDVWLSKTPPAAARVGVLVDGYDQPLFAVAAYREYVQTKKDGDPNAMWRKMPANQLAKCAESLALRKAFPDDLSGIYTDAEMGQADSERPAASAPRQVEGKSRRALPPQSSTPEPLPPLDRDAAYEVLADAPDASSTSEERAEYFRRVRADPSTDPRILKMLWARLKVEKNLAAGRPVREGITDAEAADYDAAQDIIAYFDGTKRKPTAIPTTVTDPDKEWLAALLLDAPTETGAQEGYLLTWDSELESDGERQMLRAWLTYRRNISEGVEAEEGVDVDALARAKALVAEYGPPPDAES